MEYKCEDCDWVSTPSECRKCGGNCVIVETPEDAAAERVRNAAPGLLKALEEYVAYFDNYDIDEEFPDFQAMRDRAVGVLVTARARGVSEEDDQERARRA